MSKFFTEMINKTLELIAIDSVQSEPCSTSPFGEGIGKCIETVLNTAKRMGFSTHNEDGYYGTATIGSGEEFGIIGHLDTVPYNINDWNSNPLGEIKNGTVYGRGVLDDKGPMMCCLYAVYELLQEGFTPNKKIKFIFGGNEESGWKCIERYNQVDTMPYTGISPDADFPVINCEKGIVEISLKIPKPPSLVKIKGGSRSNVVIDSCDAIVNTILKPSKDINISIEHSEQHTYIKALGIAAHGSTPEKGDNAFLHILKYLSFELGGKYTYLESLLCNTDGSGLNLNISDEKSGALSLNVGIVRDIENSLELVFDIRYPITFTKEFIRDKINEAFNTTTATITHFHDPLFVDANDPLIINLLNAYEKVTKTKATPITIGGGTYARALKHGVGFGPIFPGQESTIHSIDERATLIDLERAYNVYYEAIKTLCF